MGTTSIGPADAMELIRAYPGQLLALFLFNALFVGLGAIYLGLKKAGPVILFLIIAVIFNFVYYKKADAAVKKDMNEAFKNSKTVFEDPGPPDREYPEIKSHTIERNYETGTISAADKTGFSVPFKRSDPNQLYVESFYVVMNKEGQVLKTDEDFINYARLMILFYYNESEPIYPQNKKDLEIAAGKLDKIGKTEEAESIRKALDKIKKTPAAAMPIGLDTFEWDLDGESLNWKDPNIYKVLSQAAPTRIKQDYEGGKIFRLFSLSLRYGTFTEWQFRIFSNSRVEVVKLNEISPNIQNN